jgi:ABC-type nitrate/sulfonate/bicarbonate transport system substrate-binding protein
MASPILSRSDAKVANPEMTRWRIPFPDLPRAAVPLAMLVALAALRSEAGDPAPRRPHLKVLYERYLSFAPFAIANAEGFFAAQGLDVELVHMTTTGDAIPALIRGEIDVGAEPIRVADFNTIARGAELRIVADMGHDEPGPCVPVALMARPAFLRTKSNGSPDHLRRARISAAPLSIGEYVLETFVNSRGLKLSDLTLLRLQAATAVAALSEGSLDFSYVSEPFVSLAARSGRAVVWVRLHEIVPGAQLATLLYGPTLLTKNGDAGRRFMVAYLQGVRQYNRGKTARNVEIMSKETGLAPEVVRGACWIGIRGDGSINVKSLLDFQRWAVRRGVLDAPLPPEKFWDPSFLDAANKVLGPPGP